MSYVALSLPTLSSLLRTLYTSAHGMSHNLPDMRHTLDVTRVFELSARTIDFLIVAGDIGVRVCIWLDHVVYVAVGVPGLSLLVPLLVFAKAASLLRRLIPAHLKIYNAPLHRADSNQSSPSSARPSNPAPVQNPRPARIQTSRPQQPSASSGTTRRTRGAAMRSSRSSAARDSDSDSLPPPYTP